MKNVPDGSRRREGFKNGETNNGDKIDSNPITIVKI